MSVKVIRPEGVANYNVEPRRVRIEFKDGSHMVGLINIHSKYVDDDDDHSDYKAYRTPSSSPYKFRRTSDYLKDCNRNEGVITVFNASYGGKDDLVCFVFLHSVKFICEEGAVSSKPTAEPQPPEKDKPQVRFGSSLRDRIKKYD